MFSCLMIVVTVSLNNWYDRMKHVCPFVIVRYSWKIYIPYISPWYQLVIFIYLGMCKEADMLGHWRLLSLDEYVTDLGVHSTSLFWMKMTKVKKSSLLPGNNIKWFAIWYLHSVVFPKVMCYSRALLSVSFVLNADCRVLFLFFRDAEYYI